MMKPYMVFDKCDTQEWIGKSFKDIVIELDGIRKAIKEASEYPYDNVHYYLTNIFGDLCLSFLFFDCEFTIWYAQGGGCVLSWKTDTYTKEIDEKLHEIISQHENRKFYCSECQKFYDYKDMKRFHFAGLVCINCYDSNIHKDPSSWD